MTFLRNKEAIRWCSQKDLASKLGIGLDHLRYYIKIGKCRSVKMFGRVVVDCSFSVVTRKNKAKGGV